MGQTCESEATTTDNNELKWDTAACECTGGAMLSHASASLSLEAQLSCHRHRHPLSVQGCVRLTAIRKISDRKFSVGTSR